MKFVIPPTPQTMWTVTEEKELKDISWCVLFLTLNFNCRHCLSIDES